LYREWIFAFGQYLLEYTKVSEQEPTLQPIYDIVELGLKDKNQGELFEIIMNNCNSWTDDEQIMIISAYELVSELHKDDQLYKGKPYIYHILRNTARLVGYLHITDSEVVVAELLHDSVEDHSENLAWMFLKMEAPTEDKIILPKDPFDLQDFALVCLIRQKLTA
jgi:hypothetical protein